MAVAAKAGRVRAAAAGRMADEAVALSVVVVVVVELVAGREMVGVAG